MNGGSPDEAKHPQAVPDYFGSLWANHKFGIGDLNDGLNGLTLGSGSRVVGPSYADGANLTKVDGFALVDLAMRYDLAMLSQNLKGATATLDVRNLLDKVYYSSRTDHVYCRYGSERRRRAAGVMENILVAGRQPPCHGSDHTGSGCNIATAMLNIRP